MRGDTSKIRALTVADAESFWKLRLGALEHDPTAFRESAAEHRAKGVTATRERLAADNDDFVVGAFRDGVLVGAVGFHRDEVEAVWHKGMIWGVCVAPSRRGMGIARQMLAYAIERARAIHGLEQLHLVVAESQHAARHLYESIGFRICGTEPRARRVGDEYIDEHMMVLQFSHTGDS